MYTSILVPIDGSQLSESAIGEALSLAKALGAQVTFLTAVEPFHVFAFAPEQIADTQEAYERHARQAAEQRMADAEARARAQGVVCDTVIASAGDPHEAIIDTARERGCDLVAMASHGRRGVKAVVLGSVTAKVLTHSDIPVLVYRHADAG